MKLETLGKILSMGFGDKVLAGILMGFLDNVTPARAYEYIRDSLNLGYWVSDSDWDKYKKMASEANIGSITKDNIVAELKKYRLDILGIIINTEGGDKWLDAQIAMLKEKMGLS